MPNYAVPGLFFSALESLIPGKEGELLLSFYKPNDQWSVVTPLTVEVKERNFFNLQNFSDVVVHMRIERLTRYYRLLFILPVVLLYFLSPFVFLLPVESGEKVSMSLTILLAQVVSMGALSDILPASSTSLPVIIYFLVISIVQMGFNTVLSVIG